MEVANCFLWRCRGLKHGGQSLFRSPIEELQSKKKGFYSVSGYSWHSFALACSHPNKSEIEIREATHKYCLLFITEMNGYCVKHEAYQEQNY